MSEIAARYPNLDDFLASGFLQDPPWKQTIEGVVAHFRATRPASDVLGTSADIRRFLREQHNDIELAFEGFGPQIHPPGMGLSETQFLERIANLLDRDEPPPPSTYKHWFAS